MFEKVRAFLDSAMFVLPAGRVKLFNGLAAEARAELEEWERELEEGNIELEKVNKALSVWLNEKSAGIESLGTLLSKKNERIAELEKGLAERAFSLLQGLGKVPKAMSCPCCDKKLQAHVTLQEKRCPSP